MKLDINVCSILIVLIFNFNLIFSCKMFWWFAILIHGVINGTILQSSFIINKVLTYKHCLSLSCRSQSIIIWSPSSIIEYFLCYNWHHCQNGWHNFTTNSKKKPATTTRRCLLQWKLRITRRVFWYGTVP